MKIKRLWVATPQGDAGDLQKESRFSFLYQTHDPRAEVSLLMPIRHGGYASTTLHAVFGMSLPEGWLHQHLTRRLAKQERVDDMRLLSLVGRHQIGRLTITIPNAELPPQGPGLSQDDLLHAPSSADLFAFLADQYADSGVSGMQPKVLVPAAECPGRAALPHREWIVKSGGPEYPFLTQNEFLCMEAARCAGIPVPDCFLSDDGGLLVLRRFDLVAGQRLGFEDIAVLLALPTDPHGNYKYRGSYETVAKMIATLVSDQTMTSLRHFFEYLVLSVVVRNGDAHLKNFGLLYTHPGDRASVCLAPLYDVVTTTVYPDVHPYTGVSLVDRTMALKMNGVKRYPTGVELARFGREFCGVHDPEDVMDRIATAVQETLQNHVPHLAIPTVFQQQIRDAWNEGLMSVTAMPHQVISARSR